MTLSRRTLLVTLPAAGATAAHALSNPFRRSRPSPAPMPLTVYIGTNTGKSSSSKGIYRARFDTKSGHLSQPELAAATTSPSFLAMSPRAANGRILYAVNEGPDASTSGVVTFSIDAKSGDLRELGRVPSGAAGPTYVSVDSTGHTVFTANYAGGSVSSYLVQPNGTLSGPVEQIDFKQPRFGKLGPNAGRQDASHPHCANLSPDNRFLLVSDLGKDEITVFSVDPGTARLTLDPTPQFSNGTPGSGPRHLAFHPNGRWLYSINELTSTIDHFLWSATHTQPPQAMLINTQNSVSTLDPKFSGKSTGAEIAVEPTGHFLYASNRGEDSLVVFRIDQANGNLQISQRIGCGGKTPRQFSLDPTGNWIVVSNQNSANVTTFRRDGGTGQLSGPVSSISVDTPVFALFS